MGVSESRGWKKTLGLRHISLFHLSLFVQLCEFTLFYQFEQVFPNPRPGGGDGP